MKTEDKMKRDDVNNNIYHNDYCNIVRICFIDVKSFNSKTKCPICKHEFVSDVKAAICSIYEIMSLITSFIVGMININYCIYSFNSYCTNVSYLDNLKL